MHRVGVICACMVGALIAADGASAARRVLYVTTTAGFRHSDSIDASVQVMQDLAQQSGIFEVVHTEDLSVISGDNLRSFDAVYFFTSGELPLSDQQKADLLDFVRQGKGFGGSHSATDTLYSWPDYGDMIGAYFDGHPWTQEAAVEVEDPENPIVRHMAPSFSTLEEFYQFRSFSRDKVRVLLTLDARSVDMSAPGVNRTDGDFALAWVRNYGKGRVFYSAFGHFPDSFRQGLLRKMLLNALLWLVGEIELDATPRSGSSAAAPAVSAGGVRNLAGSNDAFAPGAIVTLEGTRLTSGSSLSAAAAPLPVRLAGTHIEVDGKPAPLFSAAPDKVLAQLPSGLTPGTNASLIVSSVNRASDPVSLRIESAAPSIAAVGCTGNVLIVYATGLGATDPAVDAGAVSPAQPLALTLTNPAVRIADRPATLLFSGLAPGLVGAYQLNVLIPADAVFGSDGTADLVLDGNGRQARAPVPACKN